MCDPPCVRWNPLDYSILGSTSLPEVLRDQDHPFIILRTLSPAKNPGAHAAPHMCQLCSMISTLLDLRPCQLPTDPFDSFSLCGSPSFPLSPKPLAPPSSLSPNPLWHSSVQPAFLPGLSAYVSLTFPDHKETSCVSASVQILVS